MKKSRDSGFSGAISVKTLPELVQLYVLSNAVGMMEVQRQDGLAHGKVWFDNGAVTAASVTGEPGEVLGEEAFYMIMAWDHGHFGMRQNVRSKDRNVRSNWQRLVIESARRADEDLMGGKGKRTGWTERPPTMPEVEVEVSFEELDEDDFIRPFEMKEETIMNVKDALAKLAGIDGFVGASLVDSDSGMSLGSEGGGNLNLEVAAAGNTEVVRAKRKTMANLALKDGIEDILITLGKQYHLIRPLRSKPEVFFYLALDRSKANLAMARISLADVEKELQI